MQALIARGKGGYVVLWGDHAFLAVRRPEFSLDFDRADYGLYLFDGTQADDGTLVGTYTYTFPYVYTLQGGGGEMVHQDPETDASACPAETLTYV